MDFSPRHAETLQLSPSHLHAITPFHDDLKSLRRGISRSPSKISRLQRSSPSSPSHQSPLRQHFNPQAASTSALRSTRDGGVFSAARKVRSSLARATPMRGSLFSSQNDAPSPQPARRPLSIASGNSSSQSSQDCADGQENQVPTPEDTQCDENIFNIPKSSVQNSPFKAPSGRPKSIAVTEREFLRERALAKSSPLKRSDGVMNLDRPSFGSPSAKRRSLHGAPFEIAKDDDSRTEPMQFSGDESDSEHVPHRGIATTRPTGTTRKKHVPFRASDRGSNPRNRQSLELDFSTPAPRKNSSRNKARTSLDGGIGQRNDASESPIPGVADQRYEFAKPARPQPHPLSRTMTPASPLQSGFSHASNTQRVFPDTPNERPSFSKSLPIGAIRPQLRQSLESSQVSSSDEITFTTPKPFDDARPDPAAFRSTGLISKRHRNPDDMPPPPAGGFKAMPDTPCKKMPMSNIREVSDGVSPPAITGIAKPRFGQPLFAAPAKAFERSFSKPLFGSQLSSETAVHDSEHEPLNRSTSFVSTDGSDSGRSPNGSHGHADSQSSADDLPPTPTKQLFGFTSVKPNGKNVSLRSSLFGRRTTIGPSTFSPPDADQQPQEPESARNLCKSPSHDPESRAASTSDFTAKSLVQSPPPSTSASPLSSLARPRQTERRLDRKEPSPLMQEPLRVSKPHANKCNDTKTRRVPIVSQSLGLSSTTPSVAPQTPAEMGVPDPSQLSISPTWRGARTPSWRGGLRSSLSKAPETPSCHHGNDGSPNQMGTVMTPSHHNAASHEVDPVLSERFRKVVWLGRGEFSDVFKVHEYQQRSTSGSFLSPTQPRRSFSRSTSMPISDTVYVVKKSKAPLHGSRVRERTSREVQVMQALGHHEHIVTLVDSWEARSHLYLMTEYCEEGSLDAFLQRTGHNGRLDDFRIWKIMLEIATGLKHIHDAGFLHLDLKPENVFIDFSGTLKIGDFGLACDWPAPRSVEGEGDRRYMGPDLLMGNFDKPADIFAFGMMMYEIAGNCVPPDNGTNWHKLRSGDFSGLPSLTSASSDSQFQVYSDNFASGDYNNRPFSPNTVYSSRPDISKVDSNNDTRMISAESLTTPRVEKRPSTELIEPPTFMFESAHPASLDNVVHWMMAPLPLERPVIDQVLEMTGCLWVAGRRRAGAIVWEGKWGPSDVVLSQNSMTSGTETTTSQLFGATQETPASQGTFLDDADAEMMDA
ncbi:MAG: hypothetical protein Q9162_006730 [Coniocarpon cinnabarinum]